MTTPHDASVLHQPEACPYNKPNSPLPTKLRRKFTSCAKRTVRIVSLRLKRLLSCKSDETQLEIVPAHAFQSSKPPKPHLVWEKVHGRYDCGEDAFIVFNSSGAKNSLDAGNSQLCTVLGIADGVGGSGGKSKGVGNSCCGDPAHLAWRFLEISKKIVQEDEEESCKNITELNINYPRDILQKAGEIIHQGFVDNKNSIENMLLDNTSTTLTMAMFHRQKQASRDHPSAEKIIMTMANIGDSGVLVIRDGKMLFRSKEQLIAFNTPQQLLFPYFDFSDIDVLHEPLCLQEGDIIIMGTDGLFDNMYDTDIVDIVSSITGSTEHKKQLNSSSKLEIPQQERGLLSQKIKNFLGFSADHKKTVQQIADALLKQVIQNFDDLNCKIPWTEYCEKHNKFWRGGKVDDTTIVAARVCPVLSRKQKLLRRIL